MNAKFEIRKPLKCNSQDLQDFKGLVLEGGEVVKKGLTKRVQKAQLLGLCRVNEEIVAVTAVKRPSTSYKNSIFSKASTLSDASEFLFEIGWAFVKPSFRGKSFCSTLLDKLLSQITKPIFATTKRDNEVMQIILKKNGFRKSGKPYAGRSSEVVLYLRK
jgi:predicted GNAT family N-acyltransferase